MDSEVYTQILELANGALNSKEEIGMDLLKDLADAAYTYTGYRYKENFYTTEERLALDKSRSICHNHVMDALNIFLRYEKSLGKAVPELPDDRKILGDYANQLIADLAIRRR